MHLTFRNVNEAFTGIIDSIHKGAIETIKTPSRNGPVLQIPEPVIITYTHPKERVLFNSARDANPFFHLFESLWMLAGRNDIAPLVYYAKQIENYSDDGETANGAYGYRWRHAFNKPPGSRTSGEYKGTDQLQVLIEHLRTKPESRRAVLNMWNVEDDLLKIDSSKDVCCNLSALFSIRYERREALGDVTRFLDMTVFNRSNDLIWGSLGANVVHFSMLQEYMACCIGVEVGVYNQISNNLHVYTETNSGWKPEEWLAKEEFGATYNKNVKTTIPLVGSQEEFDDTVSVFVDYNCGKSVDRMADVWNEPFLDNVAQPMCLAYEYHKRRNYKSALTWADSVKADDWRIAAMNWLMKRKLSWENKNARNNAEFGE